MERTNKAKHTARRRVCENRVERTKRSIQPREECRVRVCTPTPRLALRHRSSRGCRKPMLGFKSVHTQVLLVDFIGVHPSSALFTLPPVVRPPPPPPPTPHPRAPPPLFCPLPSVDPAHFKKTLAHAHPSGSYGRPTVCVAHGRCSIAS